MTQYRVACRNLKTNEISYGSWQDNLESVRAFVIQCNETHLWLRHWVEVKEEEEESKPYKPS